MGPAQPLKAMSAEQSAVLVDFARACRGAARSVSLYPATHPAIQASLGRVMAAAGHLIAGPDVVLAVHPETLAIDGRGPGRPDAGVAELAALMHERLIGTIRIERAAGPEDWHALLLLLARPADEILAEGGIARAWQASGRGHVEIQQIDYAEVLREREAGADADWDAIIASCLEGRVDDLDAAALLTLLGDADRLGQLLDRFQEAADADVAAKVAGVLALLQKMLEAAAHLPRAQGEDQVLQTAADALWRLTPDTLVELIGVARTPETPHSGLASAVIDRVGDDTISRFVAGSVVRENGASDRLLQAFEALVPEPGNRARLLESARDHAASTTLGHDATFEQLWRTAADILTSYSDERYVSAEYARELSGARRQAVEVERVADDPPDRIQAWLATISDEAVRQLDVQLLIDQLGVAPTVESWRQLATMAAADVSARLAAGDAQHAVDLAQAIALSGAHHPERRAAAEEVLARLAGTATLQQVVQQLRRADDEQAVRLGRLCRLIGPAVVRPLAEALVAEENVRAIRRVRELLLTLGNPGRELLDQLLHSTNPAVRRAAIELLRAFGGRDATAELVTLLDDADPQVQRDAVRALVQSEAPEAADILQRAVTTHPSTVVLDELIALRDERVVPILGRLLSATRPRGRLAGLHARAIQALGDLGGHPTCPDLLKEALYRGDWWAPSRTAALRRAAAAALRRIGSPEAQAILEEAARTGSRGVRQAVQPPVPLAPPGARSHT